MKTNTERNSILNLLPYDGTVHFYGEVYDDSTATTYYHQLLENILWESDQAVIFGRKIITKRKVAWYADQPFSYTYSNITKTARLMTPLLTRLRAEVEKLTAETYNSCLLNLYHNGSEGMAWHSDAESDLRKHAAIASLSFGATRRFLFRHKVTKEKVEITLPP